MERNFVGHGCKPLVAGVVWIRAGKDAGAIKLVDSKCLCATSSGSHHTTLELKVKNLVIACVLALTVALCNNGSAQSVPPELVGIYTGTAKITNYDSPAPVKSTASVVVQIFSDSSTQITFTGSSSTPLDPVMGQAAALANNVFVRYPIGAGFQIGGRLSAKGKPGKQSLKGELTAMVSGFTGVIDFDMKLKRLP